MTKARAFALASLCTATFAGSAAASDVEGVRAKFKEMDTNGDRSLQFSEIQATRAAIFDRMDVNANAILDRDEIDNVGKIAQSKNAQRQGGMLGEAGLAERAKLMDTNGDGKIARAEFVTYVPERLKAADKDGNQVLSLRELRSLKRDGETSATQ
jgi:Ca2+-binding EF-hand superfamily protein